MIGKAEADTTAPADIATAINVDLITIEPPCELANVTHRRLK
jgi:hypothetical protein